MDPVDEEDPAEGTVRDLDVGSERRKIDDWLAPVDQSWFVRVNNDIQGPAPQHNRSVDEDMKELDSNALLWLKGPEGYGKMQKCANYIRKIQHYSRLADFGESRDSPAYFFCTTYDL
ncbi:Uu.00g142600.m01.CDS01 [Anthostomella pinea]|uniref:Uu.00g142600.m01.CDS01 n=1 Tax=Anthostomella pinea TaxID=933095 RepID=A0AAI8VR59_9PEZI|nr:Uu.00g142600.m01.CDS01 [Anthostomella pinea]